MAHPRILEYPPELMVAASCLFTREPPPTPGTLIVVKAAWDAEAEVWWVEHSDLPGLNLEAESLETLRDKLPAAIEDLLEAAGHTGKGDVLVETKAHAHTHVRLGAAA
jgi:hypothetical protein